MTFLSLLILVYTFFMFMIVGMNIKSVIQGKFQVWLKGNEAIIQMNQLRAEYGDTRVNRIGVLWIVLYILFQVAFYIISSLMFVNQPLFVVLGVSLGVYTTFLIPTGIKMILRKDLLQLEEIDYFWLSCICTGLSMIYIIWFIYLLFANVI